MISRIIDRLRNDKIKPLAYDDRLKEAYSTASVCGGTLSGKTVLITGATGDLGHALADRYLSEGCSVILAARNERKLLDEKTYFSQKYSIEEIQSVIVDLSNIDSINKLIEELRVNNKRCNVIINNAGVLFLDDRLGAFRKISQEQFLTSWNTNYEGTRLLTDGIIKYMLDSDITCSVVNISSICATSKEMSYTPYGISKEAMIAYTDEIRGKYPRISAHVILPGSIATRMGDIKIGDDITMRGNKLCRKAIPEEIAAIAAFISSDYGIFDSSAITASACEEF